ncbi:helix-turn-helix domain-containing protein [Catenuloplanes sp. NPDC051500]|uniref:helix-turn-helix domain-containing protein n=1 Tax=Catenuloplanes sp. NPDC051500 TaxID=3363959 RepID=UPI00379B06E9
MDESAERAVRRAITTMRMNLGEQITVEDLARSAMFSKFHFSRVFQRATGVSPGRFLSALRLQRAKTLLVSTSLNVADISLCVGYNSVGTFSSRFSRSVGMSPTAYRRLAGFAPEITVDTRFGPEVDVPARVAGVIRGPGEQSGPVFVGLFADRIPEGQPVRCAVLDGPGAYLFDEVPAGSWFLLAQAVAEPSRGGRPGSPGAPQEVWVGTCGPLCIRGGTRFDIDMDLNPARDLDPPVLLALLDAREWALARRRELDRLAA